MTRPGDLKTGKPGRPTDERPMNKLLFVSITIIFCFCGRKVNDEKNSGNEKVLRIDLLSEPASEIKNLSDIAAEIRYIPLQTTDRSLMSNFSGRIVSNEKRIYIQNSQQILCFDAEGNFLLNINKEGRGPEEYTNISDFDVSSDNTFLALLSGLKLMIYGITDDGFVYRNSFSLKDPAPFRVSIVPNTDNLFLGVAPWRGNEPALSLVVNTHGDTVNIKPNCYKYTMNRASNYRASNELIVYSTENAVCFKEEFSDTVFYVDAKDNSFKPGMILDSHGTMLTPGMRGGTESYGDNTNFIANVFETPRYVFFWYGTQQTRNRILFDKTTSRKYRLNLDNEAQSTVKDDLGGGPDFNINFLNMYCSGGSLFSFVEALTLRKYVESEDFRHSQASTARKNELRKIADSIDESDNPVLVIVTPKD